MKRSRSKGRKTSGPFALFPRHVLESEEYAALEPWAVKLMVDLHGQSNGHNNGDLCCVWSIMKKRGWKSPTTLNIAKKELLETGFIQRTRKGGPFPKKDCALYAMTFLPIDECLDKKGNHKLDVPTTKTPSNLWRNKPSTVPAELAKAMAAGTERAKALEATKQTHVTRLPRKTTTARRWSIVRNSEPLGGTEH